MAKHKRGSVSSCGKVLPGVPVRFDVIMNRNDIIHLLAIIANLRYDGKGFLLGV